MPSAQRLADSPDLDAREAPTDAGRRLDAGGFILADSFETLLRALSESYLHRAWARVTEALNRYQLTPHDLSWGWLHSGETRIDGLSGGAPTDFVGWTSRELKDFDRDSRFLIMDTELRSGFPALRCAVAWRSLKWNIAPDDVSLGLRLVIALAIDDPSNWNPAWLLEHARGASGAWIEIARAIQTLDQDALDRAITHARASYTPAGYRIALGGFAAYIHQPGMNLAIQFPQPLDNS